MTTHRLAVVGLAAMSALVLPHFLANAADWAQFRGPGGLGVSQDKELPAQWSSTKNIVWSSDLPGAGSSSPIVVGDRIYLTCYTGYGLSEDDPGSQEGLMRHVVSLSRKDGRILWQKDFYPKLPVGRYEGNGARHGYSTSTIASDGERLYVFFGNSGVYCLDLDGGQVWHVDVGSGIHQWGSATSPVLFGDLVIINASIESRSLIALNKKTGERVWDDDNIRGAWNTPVLARLPDGATEMVVSLPNEIIALDPGTGERLWSCDGIPDRGYVCPSVVVHDGVIYAIGGRQNTAIAVKAGGRGDVTDSHVLWRTGKGSNVASPVYHEGHLYWLHESRGTAYCLDAKTGEAVYERRVEPRPGLVYASMTVADGKLYAVSQHNGAYVLAARPEFELLAHNTFEDDDSRINASPVIHDGQILLRSDKRLYCIGK